jgi:hypothetical protein
MIEVVRNWSRRFQIVNNGQISLGDDWMSGLDFANGSSDVGVDGGNRNLPAAAKREGPLVPKTSPVSGAPITTVSVPNDWLIKQSPKWAEGWGKEERRLKLSNGSPGYHASPVICSTSQEMFLNPCEFCPSGQNEAERPTRTYCTYPHPALCLARCCLLLFAAALWLCLISPYPACSTCPNGSLWEGPTCSFDLLQAHLRLYYTSQDLCRLQLPCSRPSWETVRPDSKQQGADPIRYLLDSTTLPAVLG